MVKEVVQGRVGDYEQETARHSRRRRPVRWIFRRTGRDGRQTAAGHCGPDGESKVSLTLIVGFAM